MPAAQLTNTNIIKATAFPSTFVSCARAKLITPYPPALSTSRQ